MRVVSSHRRQYVVAMAAGVIALPWAGVPVPGAAEAEAVPAEVAVVLAGAAVMEAVAVVAAAGSDRRAF